MWELDSEQKGKKLTITLVKAEKTRGSKHWNCVVKGGPKIDTTRFGPPVVPVNADDPAALFEAMKS